MCLVAIALDVHPRYALAIAANRDEFHARAAKPAHWWPEGWLAGRDLAAGGTWFGVRRDGRWALVTNVREPGRTEAGVASRGALVIDALSAPSVDGFVAALARDGARYNGYNLLAGGPGGARWTSNRHGPSRQVGRGVTALSNAALGTPWPKVERLTGAVAAWTGRRDDDLEPLFDALADRERAPDHALPSTGVPLERERMLSAPFIVSEDYGTRCSSVLAVSRDGSARFIERSFDAAGRPAGTVDERFDLAR
ncbi:hypothetical protein BURK1_02022 [Burkholderiales bacterium]|nr:hypothetical protein BURK1_02022 [Burkholderiales bacterium]